MKTRRNGNRLFISSGNAWEVQYGYSRAVRVGPHVRVCGTLGVEADGSVGIGVAAQAERAITIIGIALQTCRVGWRDVVSVRAYLTDISDIDAVGAMFRQHVVDAHKVRPCFLQVAVAALADPEAKVEIEAEAIASDDASD